VSYYRSLRGKDLAEDESLSRALTDRARQVVYDEELATRRRRARRCTLRSRPLADETTT
jgi:hypothetical protein